MRRPFGRGREEEGEEAINLTPMLDVVFIMLIFFIVTATFVKEVGLDVNQPDDEKPKTVDPDKKSIVVRITNRDRIIIAQRDVDRRAVRANIERLHAENPEAPVIVPRPAIMPVTVPRSLGLPYLIHSINIQVIAPAAAAR